MTDIPTEDELKRLPYRAILAFVERCTVRVQPLFTSNDARDFKILEDVIQSSSLGTWEAAIIRNREELKKMSDNLCNSGSTFHGTNVNSCVLETAYYFSKAALSSEPLTKDEFYRNSLDAIASAGIAIEKNHSDYDFSQDLDQLVKKSERENWADTTPVNHWNALGPLWPDSEPSWFTSGIKTLESHLKHALYNSNGYPIHE